MRTRYTMLAVLIGVLACHDSAGLDDRGGGIRLDVQPGYQSGPSIDAGRILVRGPSNRTVDAAPGATVKIDKLPPGEYTVALEGLVDGEVARFGERTGIDVIAGREATVTVTFASFVPPVQPLPPAAVGKTLTVSFSSIPGAVSYLVEAAKDEAFELDRVTATAEPPATSVDITVPDYDTWFVRVRARNAYQRMGVPSEPQMVDLVEPQADLIISTGMSVSPTTVVQGEEVTLSSWTVRNQGTGASSTVNSGVYLSADAVITTSDTRLSGATNGPLAPGASFEFEALRVQIPFAVPPGSYFIGVLLDEADETAETDEANNSSSTALAVTQAKADLVISAPAALSVSPSSVAPGGQVSLSAWTLTNQGTIHTGTFSLGFYLSTDATITAADRRLTGYNGALSGGSSLPQDAQSLTIPADVAPGSYFIGILLDDTEQVVEWIETNNFKSTALTVSGQADLVITTSTISVSPTSVAPGGTPEVSSFVVANQGTVASGSFLIQYFLSTDATITADDVILTNPLQVASLEPGASITIDARGQNVRAAPAGAYFIGPLVDGAGQVKESNESNNFRSTPLQVRPGIVIVHSSTIMSFYDASSLSGTTGINWGSQATALYSVKAQGHVVYMGAPGELIAYSTSGFRKLGAGVLSGAIYGLTVKDGVIYASGSSMPEIRTLTIDGTAAGNIASPNGSNLRSTAFGPDGSFYLTSFSGGPVQRWAPGFVYQGRFGGGGLAAAFGIAVRSTGDVVVVDQNTSSYHVFSRTGAFLRTVAVACGGAIWNADVDAADNVWIACNGQNAVVKFGPDDKEIGRITVPGPRGVAVIR